MKTEGWDVPEIPTAHTATEMHGWWVWLQGDRKVITLMREISDDWREEEILGKEQQITHSLGDKSLG